MFGHASFRWKLWRIEASQSRTVKAYEAATAKAKAEGKTAAELEAISQDEYHEWRFGEDEKADLRSRYLLHQANRLLLPIPMDGAAWESTQLSRRCLTRAAQRELLVAIRSEQKDRSEIARLWLVGATGLIGALTGLVALLLRK